MLSVSAAAQSHDGAATAFVCFVVLRAVIAFVKSACWLSLRTHYQSLPQPSAAASGLRLVGSIVQASALCGAFVMIMAIDVGHAFSS
jgi:hypothetical protein